MTKKKDTIAVGYGELNQLYENKDVHEHLDIEDDGFISTSRKTAIKAFTNSDISQGRLAGFILQVIEEEEQNDGLFGGLFSTPTWTAIVRIPELDAHLPEPKLIGEAALRSSENDVGELRSQDIIEMHTKFAPHNAEDFEVKPVAGQKVWVSIASGRPVILEVIESKSGENTVKIEGFGKIPNPKSSFSPGGGGSSGGAGASGSGGSTGTGGSFSSRGTLDELPSEVLKGERLENAILIINAALEQGANEREAANIVAMCQGESYLTPIAEGCYTNTSVKRIRGAMGGRVGDLTDEEIEELKKDCVKFFDHCYNGPYGSERYINSQKRLNSKGKPSPDGAAGGYKYRGRGFHQATGYSNYSLTGKFIGEDLINNPDLLLKPDVAAKALAYYYFKAWGRGGRRKILRKREVDYNRFIDIYAVTWGGWADTLTDPLTRKHRMDDVQKREKWAGGWLEYIQKNITKTWKPSVATVDEFAIDPSEYNPNQEAQALLHVEWWDKFHRVSRELYENAKKPYVEGEEPNIDEVENSALPQFPIVNGYNFLTPTQGLLYDSVGPLNPVQPRAGGRAIHGAIDQMTSNTEYYGSYNGNPHQPKLRAPSDGILRGYEDPAGVYYAGAHGMQRDFKRRIKSRDSAHWRAALDWAKRTNSRFTPKNIDKYNEEITKIANGTLLSDPDLEKLGSVENDFFRRFARRHLPESWFLSYWYGVQVLGSTKLSLCGMKIEFHSDPDENGIVYRFRFCHCSESYVPNNGVRVKRGQVLGRVGKTPVDNPHLHLAMGALKDGKEMKTPFWYSPSSEWILPPSAIVPGLSINPLEGSAPHQKRTPYSPIYFGIFKEYQTQKLSPEIMKKMGSSSFPVLEPYTENRVRLDDYGPLASDDERLVEVPRVPTAGYNPVKLHVLAADRFFALSVAAVEAGFDPPRLASGWRAKRYNTYSEYEEDMKTKECFTNGGMALCRKTYAFKSPHMTGLAMDFGNNGLEPVSATIEQQKQTRFFIWLKENAHRFGITPYKFEPWHWEVKLPKVAWETGEDFTEEGNYQYHVSLEEEPATGEV